MTKKDQEKLKEIERRFKGLLTDHREQIGRGVPITVAIGEMVSETLWLVEKLKKALKAAPEEEEDDVPAEAV